MSDEGGKRKSLAIERVTELRDDVCGYIFQKKTAPETPRKRRARQAVDQAKVQALRVVKALKGAPRELVYTNTMGRELRHTPTPTESRTARAITCAVFAIARRFVEWTGQLELVVPMNRSAIASWADVDEDTVSLWLPRLAALGIVVYQPGTYCSVTLVGFPSLLQLVHPDATRAALVRRRERGFGSSPCHEVARGGLWWQPACAALLAVLDAGVDVGQAARGLMEEHARRRKLRNLEQQQAVLQRQLQAKEMQDEERLQRELARARRDEETFRAFIASNPVWSKRGATTRAAMLTAKAKRVEQLGATAQALLAGEGVTRSVYDAAFRRYRRELDELRLELGQAEAGPLQAAWSAVKEVAAGLPDAIAAAVRCLKKPDRIAPRVIGSPDLLSTLKGAMSVAPAAPSQTLEHGSCDDEDTFTSSARCARSQGGPLSTRDARNTTPVAGQEGGRAPAWPPASPSTGPLPRTERAAVARSPGEAGATPPPTVCARCGTACFAFLVGVGLTCSKGGPDPGS